MGDMKRTATIIVFVWLGSVIAAGCSASVSAGKKTASVSEIEKKAEAKLITAAGQQPGSASLDCPGKSVEVKKGTKLNCTLTVAADGAKLATTITMTDNKGNFDAKVASTTTK